MQASEVKGRMRKYVKPELEFISFEVEADIMVNPSPAPTATVGEAYIISQSSMSYIEEADNKAWTSVDGKNWNWVE